MNSDQKKRLALLGFVIAQSLYCDYLIRTANKENVRLKTELIIREIENAHRIYKQKKKGFFK